MTPARDICDSLAARANSGRSAFQISEAIFAKIIAVLRQHFGMSYLDAELLLADLMREHEETLYAALHRHVHSDDAKDAVLRCLGDDQ